MADDPRLSYRPLRGVADLAGIAGGTALFQFRPGSGAVVFLDWQRLLLLALALFAVLVTAERYLLRRIRGAHRPFYPSLLPVLVLLFGLAVALVALVNGVVPSRSRVVRPAVRELIDLEWRTVTSVGDTLPGTAGRPTGDGIAIVESWRAPGEELQLPVGPEDLHRAHAVPHASLEVQEVDGFLGVAYVASVRFPER